MYLRINPKRKLLTKLAVELYEIRAISYKQAGNIFYNYLKLHGHEMSSLQHFLFKRQLNKLTKLGAKYLYGDITA